MAKRSTLAEVIVPTEHGGWGFTAEPLLLGLLVAPKVSSVALVVVGMAVFLARRPLRLLVADRKAGRRTARTNVALQVLAALAVVVTAGVVVAASTADGAFWVPLAVALPFAAVQQWYDLRNKQRELLPELLGPMALAAFAPAMILGGGVAAGIAVGAWLTLVARVITSVLLVRVQIRRSRDRPYSTPSLHLVGLAGVVVLTAAAVAGWAPWLAPAAMVAVVVWNLLQVSRPPTTPKFLGWSQMAFGVVVVVAFALGYHAGW
ncbi:MAG: YwiC-like family protein [Thermoleophilia bacterium]